VLLVAVRLLKTAIGEIFTVFSKYCWKKCLHLFCYAAVFFLSFHRYCSVCHLVVYGLGSIT